MRSIIPFKAALVFLVSSSFVGLTLTLKRESRAGNFGQQVPLVSQPVFKNFVTDFEDDDDVENSASRKRRDFNHQKKNVDSEEEAEEELDPERRNAIMRKRMAKDNAFTDNPIDSISHPEGYSIYNMPKDQDGNPIQVYVSMRIKNILDLDEMQEMIRMDVLFIVRWADFPILHMHNKSATIQKGVPKINELSHQEIKEEIQILNNPNILNTIWKPNLFIENLLSVKQPALMAKPVTIKFIPRIGWFEYLTRLTIKMDCEMDFHYYPADSQYCDFSIRGFSYGQMDLALHWLRNGAYLDDITLPSFDVRIEFVDKIYWQSRKNSKDPNDVFEVLRFRISARRKLSYHFVQTYMASTFYIIITTLCFLLPSRMIEARIGISMTTLLTLTAMFAAVRESTPIVSYVKAIDIWMVGCIFFVFLTLAQFTFHTWLKGVQEEEEQAKGKVLNENSSTPEELEALRKPEMLELGTQESGNGALPKVTILPTNMLSNMERMVKITEKYSFPFFLSLFAFYTFIYWTWLLSSADYFNWSINAKWNNLEETESY